MARQPLAINSRNRAALVFFVISGKTETSVVISALPHAQQFYQMMDIVVLIESPDVLQNLCRMIAA